jgi:DNA/RNA endonuclease YhcR with UshA esterase domain
MLENEMAVDATATVEETTAQGAVSRKPRGETHSKIKEILFVENDGTIKIEALKEAFKVIIDEATRSNLGNGAAARRFRAETSALEKKFMELRKASPKK